MLSILQLCDFSNARTLVYHCSLGNNVGSLPSYCILMFIWFKYGLDHPYTCVIWLISRQQIIGARCSWMTTSTITHCTSITRTLALTLGLLPSSLGPLLHGLEIGLFFKRRRDLQVLKELPKEMEEELRMMKTWQIWLIISLEEPELPSHDLLNLWTFIYCFYYFVTLFIVINFVGKKLTWGYFD